MESHLLTPAGCLAGPTNDLCIDDAGNFVSYQANADIRTAHSFAINFVENGVYRHFVTGISGSHDWRNSQTSVAIYQPGAPAWIALNIEAGGGLCRDGVVRTHRFWHSFSINTATGQADPISNKITCNPLATTGEATPTL